MPEDKSGIELRKGPFTVKLTEDRLEAASASRFRSDVLNVGDNDLLASYLTRMDRDNCEDSGGCLVITDEERYGRIAGACPLMLGSLAEKGRGYYSEGQFDLDSIRGLPGEKLELGRLFVHRQYRSAHIISLLWAGIARYIEMHNVRFVFGCAGLDAADEHEINEVYSYLHAFHEADIVYRVYPYRRPSGIDPHPVFDQAAAFRDLPAIVKGYLRAGALICGEPASDAGSDRTDLFLLIQTGRLAARYEGRFFTDLAEPLCEDLKSAGSRAAGKVYCF